MPTTGNRKAGAPALKNHRPTAQSLARLALTLLLAGNFLAAASAQEAGIAVTGTGEVKAKPNRAEIVLKNAGTAELTGDAITKYQDSLRRTMQAIEGLKLSSVEITQEGLGVATAGGQAGQQVVFNAGDQGANVKLEMAISRSLRVSLTGVDKLAEDELIQTLARILDAAQDSGAKLAGVADNNAMMARMMGMAGTGSDVCTRRRRGAARAGLSKGLRSRTLARRAPRQAGRRQAGSRAVGLRGDRSDLR